MRSDDAIALVCGDDAAARSFWSKVQRGRADQCWPWTRAATGRGYGRFAIRRGGRCCAAYSHRIAWSLTRGRIPGGLCVLHHCDTPACCNPGHLFLGSVAENNADMQAKGRHARGERNGNARMSEAVVRDIRKRLETQRPCEIARALGVPADCVSSVKHGKRWAWLD